MQRTQSGNKYQKLPAWNTSKVKGKQDVIDEVQQTKSLRYTVGLVSSLIRRIGKTLANNKEAEIISLDAGLTMEALLAFTWWDIVIHVLEPLVCRARRDPSRQLKNRTLQTTQESIDIATRNPPRASRLSFGFSFSKHHASMAVQNLAEAQWLPHALTSGALEAKPRIRRFARAELRIEQRLYFCELPDSPRSSSETPVTDDSNEDDFNYGSLNDQAGQPFLDSYGADQINQVHLTDCTSGSSSTTQALS